MTKVLTAFLLLTFVFPCIAESAGCGTLTKQLARLRTEYQRFVNGPELKPEASGFDDLAEILDKIVDVKAEMRKTNCKIPPRPRSLDKDR